MSKQIIPIIIGALIIAGGAFYGGTIYAKSKAPAGRGTFAGRTGAAGAVGAGGGGRGGMMAGFASGKIISMDDKSITVEMSTPGGANANGAAAGSKIVFTSDDMKVYKTEEGSKTDLTQGANVTVTGTPNSDGSITAQSIQIRPEGMTMQYGGAFGGGRGAGGQAGGSAAPTPAPAQ